jgi:hypothetical protein
MNISIYVLYFAVFISFYIAVLTYLRVVKFDKSVSGLDWEAVATLLGDVATVKRSITRLNGRLNGMDSPKYDVEQEIMKGMSAPPKPQTMRGG